MSLNADTLEYEPDMASTWTVSPDGKTFTFTLKDGLTWSDGQPVTVDDFSFAYENAVKDENNFVGLDDVQRIDTFETPDPKTIVVTLKELLARDIAISVASGIGPVPKHVWQGKSWTDTAANPEILRPTVVSGAFIGMPRVKQHQLIYRALGGRMGGELHALQLETAVPVGE